MCQQNTPEFIWEDKPKERVYQILNAQLNALEQSTIVNEVNDSKTASENSIELGFKLFPILETISTSVAEKTNTRDYLHELGYSGFESDLIYSMFRNGLLHTLNPYHFMYNNGEVGWGLMSSSGTTGFAPHFPGYKNKENPTLDVQGDKAFIFSKLSDGNYHAGLSLDMLISQLRYDLKQRELADGRKTIKIIVGQRKHFDIPS